MPNYCKNVLSVTGPEPDIATFAEKACGKVHVFAGSSNDPPDDPEEVHALSFHELVPIPAGALALPYDAGPAVKGIQAKSGYQWEVELWGVKWGALSSKLERAPGNLVYSFLSPTTAPSLFIAKVSEMFPTLTFYNQWAVEDGREGFGSFRAKEGQLTETWPDWIEDDFSLGCVPREVKARVCWVASCDADRALRVTPWSLFEDDSSWGKRSGLDYVKAATKNGSPVAFYVDARQAQVGATYEFHTTGQVLRVVDGGEVGERAHVTRLWRPR